MDQGTRQIIGGIEQAQTGDKIEPGKGKRLLYVDSVFIERAIAVGPRQRGSLPFEPCAKRVVTITDHEGVGWPDPQETEAIDHIFNHVVDDVGRAIGFIRSGSATRTHRIAADWREDDGRGGRGLAHAAALPCAAARCKRYPP